MAAEARPKSFKIVSEGEPGTCSEIGGLWAGECVEEGKPQQAKLQIFQDHCTDIAFFDFDSSIPQVYKIGREARVISSRFAESFANFTAYASWSDDRRILKISRLVNGEWTESRIIRNKMEETYVIALKGDDMLQTNLKGKVSSSDRHSETYETTCTYRRAN
jgi:hypothetical protein